MKNISFPGNKGLKSIFPGSLLLLSLAGWTYFLFLWIFLGYKWVLFPLEISFNPLLLSFLKLPLFFKVCFGFVVLWWHLVLFHYKKNNRMFYIFLSLLLALGLIAEQFAFILTPLRTYRNTLKVNLKAAPVNHA